MSELGLREFHSFQAAGRSFAYLVPSAAVFELDEAAAAVLDQLRKGTKPLAELVRELSPRFSAAVVEESVRELLGVRAIGEAGPPIARPAKVKPPGNFPLTTMVLNITNQCNLSCAYCYEYGEDKIVETENGAQSKFMSEETARESVDFLLRESGIANREGAGRPRRRHPDRERRGAKILLALSQSRREGPPLAHLVAADHSGRLGVHGQAHDRPQRPPDRAGRSAGGGEVPGR